MLLALGCATAGCQTSAAPDTAATSSPAPSKAAPAITPKPNAQSTTQPAAADRPATTSQAKPDKKAKPPLDARQKQAVSLLQSVQSDLGRYSPEMQTYLLQEMARAYKDLDRAKQVELLKEAFQSAANISDDRYRTEQEQKRCSRVERGSSRGPAGHAVFSRSQGARGSAAVAGEAGHGSWPTDGCSEAAVAMGHVAGISLR